MVGPITSVRGESTDLMYSLKYYIIFLFLHLSKMFTICIYVHSFIDIDVHINLSDVWLGVCFFFLLTYNLIVRE